jgi:hypothetical protein
MRIANFLEVLWDLNSVCCKEEFVSIIISNYTLSCRIVQQLTCTFFMFFFFFFFLGI